MWFSSAHYILTRLQGMHIQVVSHVWFQHSCFFCSLSSVSHCVHVWLIKPLHCKYYCQSFVFCCSKMASEPLKSHFLESEQWVLFQNRTNIAVIRFHRCGCQTAGLIGDGRTWDVCQMNCGGQTNTRITCVRNETRAVSYFRRTY